MSITMLSGVFFVDSFSSSDLIQMILHAGLMVKVVLLILCLFSITSWTIIFKKWNLFRKTKEETEYFFDLFWDSPEFGKIYRECDDLTFSPVAHLFKAGYSELLRIRKIRPQTLSTDTDQATQSLSDNVQRALAKTAIHQSNRLEQALSFLATTGNAAPFIGLFGTVWGIMESFRGIGVKGSASLAVVAPGISEALIATAAGLVAAIPAVVAYNYFSQKVLVMRSEMDTFSSDFLSLVERQAIKKQTNPKEI